MTNMSLIARYFFAAISGSALTWLVIHIPGEYAYASLWLMPALAAFFACATGFVMMYHSMEDGIAFTGKLAVSVPQTPDHLRTADVFNSIGRVCIGTGVLSGFLQIISSPTHCSWELPFSMGVGILVGVKALRKMSVRRLET